MIFRIHKCAFPAYARRFGEDVLSRAILVLYDKIPTYNLRSYDRQGNFFATKCWTDPSSGGKPVRFVSYIWKFIDGLILASLRKELHHEK